MNDYIQKFKKDIKNSKTMEDLRACCFKHCVSGTSKEMEENIDRVTSDLISTFEKRYRLFSEQENDVSVAMAVSKVTNNPLTTCRMPGELESIKGALLKIEDESIISLGSSLLGSDGNGDFCRSFVVFHTGAIIKSSLRSQ